MNVRKLINLKEQGRRITAITAYDYSFATIAESANIDIILVGDSGAMVMFGYENTTPATMEEMLLMTKAVSRGAKKPLLVADMPFMSYHVSIEESIRNAGKFVKDSGMHAVKLEGDRDIAKTIRAITKTGIPVMAHIGLKPQTAKSWDGYKLQGTTYSSAKKLIEDAQELESAGAFCIVLEMVTKEISKLITENLSIPTIGIGSGQYCDGQILVLHDMLNLYDAIKPRFVKQYADLKTETLNALTNYKEDVVSGKFPDDTHSQSIDSSELIKLKKYFVKVNHAEI
ncbi:MAG: 3-methyl-2-oxobutanoate hydroxymethyltransferase [Thaumarchaeota archaeon]|nr:3-methyl-2-oxobutanoate hydroxymethyltransferase [Nitrososphaerota archaeon]